VTEHLAERRQAHQARIIGDPGVGSFHSERDRLIEAVGGQAQRAVELYDKQAEAQKIAEGAQTAVAALAVVEVGAVSLGTLVAILATTATADITGVLLASVVATLGLFVIPARRRRAKTEMQEKIGAVRTRLMEALRFQFSQELNRSLNAVQTAIAPYSRFVRAEQAKFEQARAALKRIQTHLESLRVRIDALGE
jgi:hypothetical protein